MLNEIVIMNNIKPCILLFFMAYFSDTAVEAQKEVLHSVAIVSRISCFGWLLKRASTY